MPTKCYNAFGSHGVVVMDPDYLVKLDAPDCEPYGMLVARGLGVQEVIQWLVMADRGIPLGEVATYCEEHNPTVLFWKRGGKWKRFPYTPPANKE